MKDKIKKYIETLGYIIESEEIEEKSTKFYFNNGNERYFIEIKNKGII